MKVVEKFYRKALIEVVQLSEVEAIKIKYKRQLNPKVKPHSIGTDIIGRLVFDLAKVFPSEFTKASGADFEIVFVGLVKVSTRIKKSDLEFLLHFISIDEKLKNNIFIYWFFIFVFDIMKAME